MYVYFFYFAAIGEGKGCNNLYDQRSKTLVPKSNRQKLSLIERPKTIIADKISIIKSKHQK